MTDHVPRGFAVSVGSAVDQRLQHCCARQSLAPMSRVIESFVRILDAMPSRLWLLCCQFLRAHGTRTALVEMFSGPRMPWQTQASPPASVRTSVCDREAHLCISTKASKSWHHDAASFRDTSTAELAVLLLTWMQSLPALQASWCAPGCACTAMPQILQAILQGCTSTSKHPSAAANSRAAAAHLQCVEMAVGNTSPPLLS